MLFREDQKSKFVFCIETTKTSRSLGLVHAASRSLYNVLHNPSQFLGLSAATGTKIGIITFDSRSVTFYRLRSKDGNVVPNGHLSYDKEYKSIKKINENEQLNPNNLDVDLLEFPDLTLFSEDETLFTPCPASELMVDVALYGFAFSEKVLKTLPTLFPPSNESLPNSKEGSCIGAALRAALALIGDSGGKIMCFASCPPSVGPLASIGKRLNSINDNSNAKTANQSSNFQHNKKTEANGNRAQDQQALFTLKKEAEKFSHNFALHHVSIDLILCPNVNVLVDVETMKVLTSSTSGEIILYQSFEHVHHTPLMMQAIEQKFSKRSQGWDAVMRFRISRGWKISGVHGNFCRRSNDLLIFPSINSTTSVAVFVDLDEDDVPSFNSTDLSMTSFSSGSIGSDTNSSKDSKNAGQPLIFQAVLVYTTIDGERRVRVLTTGVSSAPPMISTAHPLLTREIIDAHAFVSALALRAFSGIDLCNSSFSKKISDPIASLKACIESIGRQIPDRKFAAQIAVLGMGLLRTPGLQVSGQYGSGSLGDFRAFSSDVIRRCNVKLIVKMAYPSLIRLPVDSDDVDGINKQLGGISWGQPLNLTYLSLSNHGAFLLDDGAILVLWIGSLINPNWVFEIFGIKGGWAAMKKRNRSRMWRNMLLNVADPSNWNGEWGAVRKSIWKVLINHILVVGSTGTLDATHSVNSDHDVLYQSQGNLFGQDTCSFNTSVWENEIESKMVRVFESVILEGDNDEASKFFNRFVEDATSGYESFSTFFQRIRIGLNDRERTIVGGSIIGGLGKVGGPPTSRNNGSGMLSPAFN